MLGGLGVRIGSRARVDSCTEVVFKKVVAGAKHRPDGLIVVNTGKSVWTALVEAKVGRQNEPASNRLNRKRFINQLLSPKVDRATNGCGLVG